MLNLEQISQQFPVNLHKFERALMREYLQYKILYSIFNSDYSNKLSFLGGTALRLIYNNTRFSEDLDFDNFDLKTDEFEKVAQVVKKDLENEGAEVEISFSFKNAFRCNIRLPNILFDNKISTFKTEKILIQIDTVPHNFHYRPDDKILSKFDVFTSINVTPLDILLSQKIYAAFNRKRAKGRDFHDIIFLISLNVSPNYDYLKKNIDIGNKKNLKKYIIDNSENLNFQELAKDVEKFLINPKDTQKILLFREFIEQKL